MIKLKILKVEDIRQSEKTFCAKYMLQDVATNDKYMGRFDFWDVIEPPDVNDHILWNEKNCFDRE